MGWSNKTWSINEFVKYLDISLYPAQIEYLKEMFAPVDEIEHVVNKFQFINED